jgi:FixJ family two-component response regulator
MTTPWFLDYAIVHLIPGDPTLLRVLKTAAQAGRWPAEATIEAHACLEDFLDRYDPSQPGCLLYTLSSGSEDLGLLEVLAERGIHLPVVLLSSSAETARVVQAIRSGAINFLTKPFSDDQLAAAVNEAILVDLAYRQETAQRSRIERRFSRLTMPERQVLEMLVDGRSHKQIAVALRLSVRAIEVRRAKVVKKMGAHSLADLVRMTLTVQMQRNGPTAAPRVVRPT